MSAAIKRPRLARGAAVRWLAEQVEREHSVDECVLWPFTLNAAGYGQISFRGKTQSASRVALILASGEEPDGLHAAHAPGVCHNRACVNPLHLRWATRFENGSLDRSVDQVAGHLGLSGKRFRLFMLDIEVCETKEDLVDLIDRWFDEAGVPEAFNALRLENTRHLGKWELLDRLELHREVVEVFVRREQVRAAVAATPEAA